LGYAMTLCYLEDKLGKVWSLNPLLLSWINMIGGGKKIIFFGWKPIDCGFGIGWGFGGKRIFCLLSYYCIAKCKSEIKHNCIWLVNWAFHYTSNVLVELRDCTTIMFTMLQCL
jgi:hypothetical protein